VYGGVWLAQEPDLTQGQRLMPRTKVAEKSGQAVGISIGCMLGMVPLLWLNTKKKKQVGSRLGGGLGLRRGRRWYGGLFWSGGLIAHPPPSHTHTALPMLH
jgi:hypothetical protein